jgi:hypothetical protein
MPAKDIARCGCLEVTVEPVAWFRRLPLFPFPFFFEHHITKFRLLAKRISDGKLPDDIYVHIHFSNGTVARKSLTPCFEPPANRYVEITQFSVVTAYPGQTIIVLPDQGEARFPDHPAIPQNGRFETLYAYRVRSEEQLWVWAVGLGLILATISAQLMGSKIQADATRESQSIVQPAPIPTMQPVINIYNYVVVPTPEQ